MSKLFVMPRLTDRSSLCCIALCHPKDGSKCNFLLDTQQNRIYELNVQQNKYHSWFVQQELIHDGNLYVVTPIDPLFLLIPYICTNTSKYRTLFDLLAENDLMPTQIESLKAIYSVELLRCICQVQVFEDDVFIKFDKERTLKWLSLKFERIKNSLIKLGIGKKFLCVKVSNYSLDEGQLSEDCFKVLAFETLTDYISPELEKALRDTLRSIPNKNELFASIDDKVAAAGNKRKLDSDFAFRGAFSSSDADSNLAKSKILNDAKKKPKLTRAQLVLSKSDKSGMKNIATYFQKKK